MWSLRAPPERYSATQNACAPDRPTSETVAMWGCIRRRSRPSFWHSAAWKSLKATQDPDFGSRALYTVARGPSPSTSKSVYPETACDAIGWEIITPRLPLRFRGIERYLTSRPKYLLFSLQMYSINSSSAWNV